MQPKTFIAPHSKPKALANLRGSSLSFTLMLSASPSLSSATVISSTQAMPCVQQEGQAGGMTRPANERRRFIFGRTRLPEAQPVSAAESAVAGALHLDFSKPKENLTDEQVRDKWIGDVPHEPLPGMMEMLAKAAWKPSPDAPGGLILLTSGQTSHACSAADMLRNGTCRRCMSSVPHEHCSFSCLIELVRKRVAPHLQLLLSQQRGVITLPINW